mmetsp:Transcript_92818/g.165018  ORF Transcript_92818/g.165018 Transcript_92818/m.165018 type:complete len:87 (-) Transcript_92818:87-347(-)
MTREHIPCKFMRQELTRDAFLSWHREMMDLQRKRVESDQPKSSSCLAWPRGRTGRRFHCGVFTRCSRTGASAEMRYVFATFLANSS